MNKSVSELLAQKLGLQKQQKELEKECKAIDEHVHCLNTGWIRGNNPCPECGDWTRPTVDGYAEVHTYTCGCGHSAMEVN